MARSSLICLVLLAVSVFSENVDACCFPEQWEGGHTEYVPRGPGYVADFYIRSNTSFDLTNKRVAARAVVHFGKQRFHMKAIADWTALKTYYIYKLKGVDVCRVRPIKHPLPPHFNCFLSTFRRLGSYRIGVGKDSLKLDAYGFFKENFKNVMRVAPGCIPVRDTVFYKFNFHNRKRELYCTSSWYDIIPGIKNASVFNLPEVCKKSEDYNLMNHINGLDAPSDLLSHFRNSIFESLKKSEASEFSNIIEMLKNEMPHMEIRSLHSSMTDIFHQALEHAKQLNLDEDFMNQHLFTQL